MSYTVSFSDLQEQDVAVEHGVIQVQEIPTFLEGAFGDVAELAASQGGTLTGPPFARYVIDASGTFQIRAGFPVSEGLRPAGRVLLERLPAGRVAHAVHAGPYDTVGAAYEAVMAYVVENGCTVVGDPWEVYLDDPDVPEPHTEVFVPCAPLGELHEVQDAG